MKFPDSRVEVTSSGPDGTTVVHRPTLLISIRDSEGSRQITGLADTGADECFFPGNLLKPLGIVPRPGDHAVIIGITGEAILVRYARVDLELATSGESYRWSARVGFHAGYKVILGHQGFLDAFTASFNGRRRLLTLTPNGTEPGPIFGRA